MSTVSKNKSQQNKVIFILLAVAAVIMLVCLVVFGYMIFSSLGESGMTLNTGRSGMRPGGTFAKGDAASLMKPEEVMKAFLNEVGSEQLEDAYDRTSRGFRSAMSQAEFNDFVRNKNKALLGYTKLVFKGATKTGGMMIYRGHVGGGANGGADYTLEISQEEDGWKVAKFTVP